MRAGPMEMVGPLMSGGALFSIGIDLGTTNCAVSYIDLRSSGAKSETLPIPQLIDAEKVDTLPTLPSFLYWPFKREIEDGQIGLIEGWAIGEWARKQTSQNPERVAQSAKSWLGSRSAGVEEKILPLRSEEVPPENQLSPQEASRLLLLYLKEVWDDAFQREGAAGCFENQIVTVTVPASFDAAAQEATLEAARKAGFPAGTSLLEEPQAAFMRCLESGAAAEEIEKGEGILIVDIGGGTSDFSYFETLGRDDGGEPLFKRVAVSEHILLGGDNIDLALAHAVESELDTKGKALSREQWNHLISRSRALKEQCFASADIEESDCLRIALPSRGSGLLAGSLSAEIPTAAIRDMLVEGFFPTCPANARPHKAEGGLQEWGLAYAADFAVTRYLADFLRELGPVDWVLFNGGSLSAPVLRERLRQQIGEWREGALPRELANSETGLAVARGAAYHGAQRRMRSLRVEAGARRSLYIEARDANQEGRKKLICVLPQGTPADTTLEVGVPGLRVEVNQWARFQAYQEIHDETSRAGEVREFDAQRFIALPRLETRVLAGDSERSSTEVEVTLRSVTNELGIFSLRLLGESEGERFDQALEFNVRAATPSPLGAGGSEDPSQPRSELAIDAARIEKAEKKLKSLLGRLWKQSKTLTANYILRELETVLGRARQDWDIGLLRRLAGSLLGNPPPATRTEFAFEVWLQLTGYFMRPGFGEASDFGRLERLWEYLSGEESALSKRAEVAVLIFWRRVAYGLDEERQEALFREHFALLEKERKPAAERIRLVSVLEKAGVEERGKAFQLFLDRAMEAAEESGYVAPYLVGLGNLLSRQLFRSDDKAVLSADYVAEAFGRLSKLDWGRDDLRDMQPLFLRAGRVVENQGLNVSRGVSKKIIKKLKKAGAPEGKLYALETYMPTARADQANAYGESLPVGLVLGGQDSS